jgi:hypothetical protein
MKREPKIFKLFHFQIFQIRDPLNSRNSAPPKASIRVKQNGYPAGAPRYLSRTQDQSAESK